ncbi:MAG: hypothetical protein O3B13_02340, partial [Planctomycetota bacterium]|nr:hypothetical protein [Planctomycetota bacterium]
EVLAREFLTVTVDLTGEAPEEVNLLYTTADQQFVDESMLMHEVEAGLRRYRCILKGSAGEGLLQGLSYRIVAGDATTRTYNVTVAQPPSATVAALRYTFPDYMELPPDSPHGSNIDTWEGTRIEIEATANMPVEFAWLQFSEEPNFPARCEEIRMKVSDDGTSLSALWQPIIRDDLTYPRFYRLQCKTKGGAIDPAPAVHSIRINADQKPEVSLIQPTDNLDVAANAIVPLMIQARDPDFRLSRVLLRMKNGTLPLPDRVVFKGADEETRILYDLRIADLNVKPGDVITWHIEARDNRKVDTPTRTLLDANRGVSPSLKFVVKAPVSEEEAQQQLQLDKQTAREKLDELDQQAGSANPTAVESEPRTADTRSDAQNDPLTEPNEPRKKPDDADPSTPPSEEPEADSSKGSGGKSGEDSKSPSNGTGENGDSQKNGSSSNAADSKADSQASREDGSSTESQQASAKDGPKKPVSNDGSQDDEVLRELLQRSRKPQSNNDDTDANGNNKPQGDSPDGIKPADDPKTSPQNQDDSSASGPPGENRDNPDPKAGDETSNSETESKTEDGNKDKPGTGKTEKPVEGSAEDPAEQDPATSKPPGQGSEPSDTEKGDGSENKSNENKADPEKVPSETSLPDQNAKTESKPSESSGTDPAGEQPTKPGDQPKDPGEQSGNQPGQTAEKQPGENTESAKPGDTSGKGSPDKSSTKPEPSVPNPKGESPGDANPVPASSQKPSDTKPESDGSGDTIEPGSDNGSNASKSDPSGKGGDASKSGRPGSGTKPGDGGQPAKGGPAGANGDPSKGDPTPVSSTSDSSGADSGNKGAPKGAADSGQPGKGDPKASPEAGSKPGTDPASAKPGESSSEGQPGTKSEKEDSRNDGQSGKQTGGKPEPKANPGQQKSGSEPDGGQQPGKSDGKSGSGQSGNGSPNGGKGTGQSTAEGGNPGQGTSGSTPDFTSDPGGDSVNRPDENADASDAVARPNSGANASDPNLQDADKTNLEDKLKASNMVLKRLKEELDRGDVDPELLKKLGWTEKDMQRFADRLERQLVLPKADDPGAEARRRQFEEMLRSVDLDSSGRQQDGNFRDQKSTSNFSDRRLAVPREYQGAYETYLKRLARQRRGVSPSDSK